jgi:hypothetical protein
MKRMVWIPGLALLARNDDPCGLRHFPENSLSWMGEGQGEGDQER